jgi:hypothetical protein
MTTRHLLIIAAFAAFSNHESALAQGFDSGSSGALGPLNITASTEIPLPPDGVLHYTTVTVPQGFTVTFTRNSLNTPVYLLAQGEVLINGIINVSGGFGDSFRGGDGGPGGYDGGKPGVSGQPPGAGYGPGAGRGGENSTTSASGAGGGAYATAPSAGSSTNKGSIYGSPLLIPLVGGSGGGGSPVRGGGGGGGAILIASNTRITLNGSVRANSGGLGVSHGSGGAIRLVTPVVSGRGALQATDVGSNLGGDGRIRVDTINRREFQLSSTPALSLGAFMTVFPTPVPRLDIVEAAGTVITEGTGVPVTIQLPFGADANRTVTVQARDFGATVPVEVVLIPDSGVPAAYTATIDNAGANPARVTVPVTVPANTVVTVQAWSR